MGLKVGIVGLPNVGKSTLFNALTESKSAEQGNFPFCTIEANKGIVNVPDERLNVLSDLVKAKRIVPSAIEFIDIAGLVEGASTGEGLGNKFLANIRETDMICQVVRLFEDSDVSHVSGTVDPIRDISIIKAELLIKDLESIQNRLKNIEKKSQSTKDKDLLAEVVVLKKVLDELDKETLAIDVDLSDAERHILKGVQLLTDKKFIYVANVDEGFDITNINEKMGLSQNETIIPMCVKIEQELSEMPAEDRGMFLEEYGMETSALDTMIKKSFEALNLISYITAGEIEVRAWTIKKGTLAPQAAGVIHTDFEKGFIRAEVVNYSDFVEFGGWNGTKEAGKSKLGGKDYLVKDGDIMNFLFSN